MEHGNEILQDDEGIIACCSINEISLTIVDMFTYNKDNISENKYDISENKYDANENKDNISENKYDKYCTQVKVKDLRQGGFVMINGNPCKIVAISGNNCVIPYTKNPEIAKIREEEKIRKIQFEQKIKEKRYNEHLARLKIQEEQESQYAQYCTQVKAKDLRQGGFAMIGGNPCKIVAIWK